MKRLSVFLLSFCMAISAFASDWLLIASSDSMEIYFHPKKISFSQNKTHVVAIGQVKQIKEVSLAYKFFSVSLKDCRTQSGTLHWAAVNNPQDSSSTAFVLEGDNVASEVADMLCTAAEAMQNPTKKPSAADRNTL